MNFLSHTRMKNGNNIYIDYSKYYFGILMKNNFKRFKIKYHPDDSIKRKEELNVALRVSIF